jgi:hypothetical protein
MKDKHRKTSITIGYECRKDELMELPVGNYKAVIDLKEDKVLVTNARMKKHWYKLCDVSVEKDTKKAREDVAGTVKHWYKKEKIICKSTLQKLYGKEIADKAPVWQYVDNPHYKCAPEMQLYLVKSMEYLYGKGEK